MKLRGDYGSRKWLFPLQQLLSAGCSTKVRVEVMLAICFLATHLPPTSTKLLWADALTTLHCKDYWYDKVLGGKGVLCTHLTFCTNSLLLISNCSWRFKEIFITDNEWYSHMEKFCNQSLLDAFPSPLVRLN